jgi:predicted dehydrogenase
MMTPPTVSRRSFLKTSAAAAAGAAAFAVPAVNVLGANETLNIGAIGTGYRCRVLMDRLARIPNVRLAAVCDVYDVALGLGRGMADKNAFATRRYQEVLNRKDIDAVVIGTPDHWHVPLTIAACAAGKDVYCEKPLTHNLAEGEAVIEAVRKHDRIVQVGTQQRSMPQFQEAYEIVRSGGIGDVHKVHLTWNRNTDRARRGPEIDPKLVDWKTFLGNAPDQPFDSYKVVGAWRWFWDFGGGVLTDLMVHFIDVVHWYFDLEHPLQATTIGDKYLSKGLWQTPDTVQTLLTYPKDLQVYFEGTFCNARNGAMLEFMGSDATLYLDRGRYEIIPELNRVVYREKVLNTDGRPRGQDFYNLPDGELLHLTNWVECVRSRKRPNAPVEAGVSAASAAHLGNQAFRSGQVVKWKG